MSNCLPSTTARPEEPALGVSVARHLAELTHLLKADNDHAAGGLSPSEIALIPEATCEEKWARPAYEKALENAYVARARLAAHLSKGLPASQYDSNGVDGMALVSWADTRQMVNSFATYNRMLWRAAEAVCDSEELPDDGEQQGIVWQVPL